MPVTFTRKVSSPLLLLLCGAVVKVSASATPGDASSFYFHSQSLSNYSPKEDGRDCVVSAHAYMNGSDEACTDEMSSQYHDPTKFSTSLSFLQVERRSEERDDEDDDEDDSGGDSSMLSNAVLSMRGGALFSPQQLLASEAMKRLLVVAIVTVAFEAAMGHVLEFVKIVMQTSPTGVSYGQVIRDITDEKGLAGLWDGFLPWGIIQAVSKGAVFGLAHSFALRFLRPLADDGILPLSLALTLAGGIGGGVQGYILSPLLLLKTRVMTNAVFREQMSLLCTTWLSLRIGADIVRGEGIITLMKGSNMFAMKRVFDWATRFFYSDMFESIFSRLKGGAPLTVGEKSASSLLGGILSAFTTLPLDVLVAKTQDAKKAGVKVSALKLFREELRERGWSGQRKAYMQGFEARVALVCLTTLVVKTGSPILYHAIFGEA